MDLKLGIKVLIAAATGIFSGLFFGPFCKAFEPIGEIYFTLFQMAVLPYIAISLIHGLGSMTPITGKRLASSGWPFWLMLWGVIFAVVFALSLMIPRPMFTIIQAGSEQGSELAKHFFAYLVPNNPLYDFLNNVIPAIAAFGLIVGIALMHIKGKEQILTLCEKGTEILKVIFLWLVVISPIAIFSRLAVVFGTISFEELYSLSFYCLGFIAAAIFLTLWALPVLLSSLTSFTYKEALRATLNVALLPFATGMTTLALPFILQYMKKLKEKQCASDSHFEGTSQTIFPICYSFGQIGNCMVLFFILFMSFYFRHPFNDWEKALISLFMLPMSVGTSMSSTNAVTFFVEQLHFPERAISLFKQASAVTLNFQALVNTAGIFTFMVLVLGAYYRSLTFRLKFLSLHLLAMILFSFLTIFILNHTLHLKDSFERQYMQLKIPDVIHNPVHAEIFLKPPSQPPSGGGDPLERILAKGILRIGYSDFDIPFSYLNSRGELVGYDIAYAYELARDLDCTLQFFPIDYDHLAEQIENGAYDVAMSAIVMDQERIKFMNFTVPYEEQDNVIVAPTSNWEKYIDLSQLEAKRDLQIAAYGVFVSAAKRHFPQAIIKEFVNDEPPMAPLLNGSAEVALWSDLQAFAWTLSHPKFVPIDYEGQLGKIYFAYPVSLASRAWIEFLNNWLSLKQQSGFKNNMTRYWLKGEDIQEHPPRWSILRNVLHWVDTERDAKIDH
jgi:Na+/H+-dicarboxylate symporter